MAIAESKEVLSLNLKQTQRRHILVDDEKLFLRDKEELPLAQQVVLMQLTKKIAGLSEPTVTSEAAQDVALSLRKFLEIILINGEAAIAKMTDEQAVAVLFAFCQPRHELAKPGALEAVAS